MREQKLVVKTDYISANRCWMLFVFVTLNCLDLNPKLRLIIPHGNPLRRIIVLEM